MLRRIEKPCADFFAKPLSHLSMGDPKGCFCSGKKHWTEICDLVDFVSSITDRCSEIHCLL